MTTRTKLTIAAAVLVILAILLLSWPTHGSTTILTGTVKDATGNPINGTLVLQLPVPAQDTTTSTAVANTPVTCRLVNGAVTGCPPLFDVANLNPLNLYYIAKAYDNSGTLVFAGNYPITGGSYNLGVAIPTSITTNNISFVNPAVTNNSNTFCCTQTFQGQIVSTVAGGTPPLVIGSSTVVPNLNTQILNGVTVSGTPSAGQTLQASGPSSAGWITGVSNFRMECVNVTPVTVANSVSLSPLQTCNIPANDIGASQTFYVDVAGNVGDAGPPTLTVGLYLDGTLVQSVTPGLAAASNQGWTARVTFTGVTIGAGGTIQPAQILWMSSPSGGGVTTQGNAASNNPVTVNTTISHTLQLQVTWGTASASNTITSSSMTVYRVG